MVNKQAHNLLCSVVPIYSLCTCLTCFQSGLGPLLTETIFILMRAREKTWEWKTHKSSCYWAFTFRTVWISFKLTNEVQCKPEQGEYFCWQFEDCSYVLTLSLLEVFRWLRSGSMIEILHFVKESFYIAVISHYSYICTEGFFSNWVKFKKNIYY